MMIYYYKNDNLEAWCQFFNDIILANILKNLYPESVFFFAAVMEKNNNSDVYFQMKPLIEF